ncbi:hypothetical protein R1flu_023140 [Riccia fluitans]|uniref:Uncharacterized protein n=1 Tax=Riccia fluitans TaxID=41844 RepID=A0ABD1XRX7_9MARC
MRRWHVVLYRELHCDKWRAGRVSPCDINPYPRNQLRASSVDVGEAGLPITLDAAANSVVKQNKFASRCGEPEARDAPPETPSSGGEPEERSDRRSMQGSRLGLVEERDTSPRWDHRGVSSGDPEAASAQGGGEGGGVFSFLQFRHVDSQLGNGERFPRRTCPASNRACRSKTTSGRHLSGYSRRAAASMVCAATGVDLTRL